CVSGICDTDDTELCVAPGDDMCEYTPSAPASCSLGGNSWAGKQNGWPLLFALGGLGVVVVRRRRALSLSRNKGARIRRSGACPHSVAQRASSLLLDPSCARAGKFLRREFVDSKMKGARACRLRCVASLGWLCVTLAALAFGCSGGGGGGSQGTD